MQIPSTEMITHLLKPWTHRNVHFGAQQQMAAARSSVTHELPSTEAAYHKPICHAPRLDRKKLCSPTACPYPSARGWAADTCTPCTPDAADSICTSRMVPTYPPTPCMTSVGSATSSASMLSMHAAAHSIPSGATAWEGLRRIQRFRSESTTR